MTSSSDDDRRREKQNELLEKLLGNPTHEELNLLQQHLDAIETWKVVISVDHDVDHGHTGNHEHDHHNA